MNIIHSTTGLIHLISATAALIFGTWIFAGTKGTKKHRQIGYAYVVSMVILNATSFMLYQLFGRWGPFHYAAVVSSASLLAGFIPVYFKKPIKLWMYLHISFMYYSVIGLYAAFASEVVVRIPGVGFWWMVMGATFVVMAVGITIFQIQSKKWFAQFVRG